MGNGRRNPEASGPCLPITRDMSLFPISLPPMLPAEGHLSLAALGFSILSFGLARRAERLYERVQDLNRDRLQVLERNLQAATGRSRLEALNLQLDTAVQGSVGARRLAAFAYAIQVMLCLEAMGFAALTAEGSAWRWLDLLWLAGLVVAGAWMWRGVLRAARVAEEATAHARRFEFLFISELRKEK